MPAGRARVFGATRAFAIPSARRAHALRIKPNFAAPMGNLWSSHGRDQDHGPFPILAITTTITIATIICIVVIVIVVVIVLIVVAVAIGVIVWWIRCRFSLACPRQRAPPLMTSRTVRAQRRQHPLRRPFGAYSRATW